MEFPMVSRWKHGLAAAVLACASISFASQAIAELLPEPEEPVILEVYGAIANVTEGRASALFDLPLLEAIGTSTIVTSTSWTEGEISFEGVLGRNLLEYVGAEGETLTAIAGNGYSIEIPVSDWLEYDVLLALEADGEPLSEDRGPIWIIYPQDISPDLDVAEIDARSVWQVEAIEVK